LVQTNNYVYSLYGKWRHPPVSPSLSCDKNYGEYTLISRESLRRYLEAAQDNFFTKQCINCKKTIRIKNFLIKSPNNEVEIICKLEWNNHYKVFGNWKCQLCRRTWKSALTWISLQKYIERVPGNRLNSEDFIMQECNKCKGSRSIIMSYESLVQSDISGPHKSHLCAKCKSGDLCIYDYDDDY
jgi:hypothetical protein